MDPLALVGGPAGTRYKFVAGLFPTFSFHQLLFKASLIPQPLEERKHDSMEFTTTRNTILLLNGIVLPFV